MKNAQVLVAEFHCQTVCTLALLPNTVATVNVASLLLPIRFHPDSTLTVAPPAPLPRVVVVVEDVVVVVEVDVVVVVVVAGGAVVVDDVVGVVVGVGSVEYVPMWQT